MAGLQHRNVTQNTTLSGLTNETHSLTVYATDTVGNTVFETVNFTIEEPPPTVSWLTPAVVIAVAVSISLIVYFAKIRKKAQQ